MRIFARSWIISPGTANITPITARAMATDHYLQRINLTLNHIRDHLADDLSLDTLAQVAGFSPFHFHRLFKSITGETVNECVVRWRLERAVALLKGAPDCSILDAALEAGFNSASNFSRSFKKRYGFSPRRWDRHTPLKERKNGQVLEGFMHYDLCDLAALQAHKAEFTVDVRTLPAQHLAYIRVIDSYQPLRVIHAYDRLITWYCARGGSLQHATLIGMSQDDPDITPLALCHYDIGLSVPSAWDGDDEVCTRELPACQIAAIHCVGDIYVVDRAIQYLYRWWLPSSRYQPDNLPAMELFRRLPSEIGWEQYDLDIAVPIIAL
jgi:AraC family transcriptional regulator